MRFYVILAVGPTYDGNKDKLVAHKDSRSYNLFAFANRLFHEDFSPISGALDWREIFMKQSVGKCKQINF